MTHSKQKNHSTLHCTTYRLCGAGQVQASAAASLSAVHHCTNSGAKHCYLAASSSVVMLVLYPTAAQARGPTYPVCRHHHHAEALCRCPGCQGAHHVISLHTGHCQDGDASSINDGQYARHFVLQFWRGLWPFGLVLGILKVPAQTWSSMVCPSTGKAIHLLCAWHILCSWCTAWGIPDDRTLPHAVLALCTW